jgi:AbrB family looped-hinge helix DNA binding protein
LGSSETGGCGSVGPDEMFCGAVTVGERGQVVIPAAARRACGINAGDKLLVFRHPMFTGVVMTKIDVLSDFLAKQLSIVEQVQALAREPATEDPNGDCVTDACAEG